MLELALRAGDALVAFGGIVRPSVGADSKPPNPEQEAFFELKVRPLLVARCFRCHGEKEQKGGIRLDSAEALLGKTPDEGVVKPGHPESSRLMEVVGYKDETKMPPDGKLPDADTQILREWIRRGAYFPSKESGTSTRAAEQSGRDSCGRRKRFGRCNR